ncbi:MAG: Mov34/MPN/PAD-1 family protein, partial [Planctomycetota bacterium]|nr:Mov34/MPN/PAD-1 family protein [Planctomycetota bacterium]
MGSEIQFGEIEESRPERQTPPDKSQQFAVVECQEPQSGELRIYVDLDVMKDMESHAESDTTVELGGVLLGRQLEDEQGQPFVVVSDSLRAQHYEATKGSFKFTHETWQQISRQREGLPPDLQMVGWYHTHPDWGVFLSGMDLF